MGESEIEEIIRYGNPSLFTQDWRVTEESQREAQILPNLKSNGPINETKVAISYGFERVVLKIVSTDTKAKGAQLSSAADRLRGDGRLAMDNDPVLSGIASSGDGLIIGESVFSLERLFKEVRVEHDVGAELALD